MLSLKKIFIFKKNVSFGFWLILGFSHSFLLDLEKRVEENIVISDVCDIVYQHTINHFSVYVTYVSNQTYQERTYKQVL